MNQRRTAGHRWAWAALLALIAVEGSCRAPGGIGPARPLRPDSVIANGGERDADILHLSLDLRVDVASKSVAGVAKHRLRGILNDTPSVRFHAVDLAIERVLDGAGRELEFTLEPPFLDVQLAEALARGAETEVAIHYHATPQSGLYFVDAKDADGEPAPQVWSQGQLEDNRHWIPTWDYPNDRLTVDLAIRVGPGLSVVSNGSLVGVEDHDDGERTYRWSMEQTLTTYLIAIAVGRWERYADDLDGIPIEYYVAPGTGPEKAMRAFGETPEMLRFFADILDRPYPYPKYAQVAVADFIYGGMENTSVTIQNDYIVGTQAEVDDLVGDPRLLVAHEAAHQWFGDLVTCLGWSHLWLNEAWASYLELQYQAFKDGPQNLHAWLERYRENFLARGDQTRLPLSEDWRTQLTETRCTHEYTKGPWVLHMLRQELGDDAFWLGVHTYLDRHAEGLVTTSDFVRAFFDATGRNIEGHIEQWVLGGGFPAYHVAFSAAAADKGAGPLTLKVNQTQRTDDLVPLFDVGVDVALYYADGGPPERHRVRVSERTNSFELPLRGPLVDVVFDADGDVLCTIECDKPLFMWVHQARIEDGVAARWRAVRALYERGRGARGVPARAELLRMARQDPEPLLRAWAAQHCAFAECLPALIEIGAGDSDPVVRRTALAVLESFQLKPHTRARLAGLLERDSSPGVREVLRRVLGLAPTPAPAN